MCVLSYALARMRPVKDAKARHQRVRNQSGDTLSSISLKRYTEKVWGMSCDEISADWAAQRIKGLDLMAAVKNALFRSFRRKPAEGGEQIKTLIESFRYPRRGPGMMWEAAAEKLQDQGGHVIMGCELQSLTWNPHWRVWDIVAVQDGQALSFTADHVISSAPISELAHALEPKPLSLMHARALRYRDFLTVALVVNKAELFPDNWIYVHDPSVKVSRIQNFLSWSPEMTPDPRYGCLGLEYFCFQGDGTWEAPDSELIALAKREVEAIGLVKASDVVDACVVRQQKAYPIYDDAYQHNVRMVRLDLEKAYPTLQLVGRNGMHKYNNQDHAMMTAMLAVRNILAGERIYDIWGVNEDAEYGEAGIAGAQEALASERLVPRKVA